MDEALSALCNLKEPFLNKVSSDIDSSIVGKGCHCLDIIEKDAEKEDKIHRYWCASVDPTFARFYTEPVCDIVSNDYQEFYQQNANIVSAGILAALKKDTLVLNAFLNRVADKALSKASGEVRKHAVHLVVHKIHGSATNGALHVVGQQVGHIAATAAGSPVAALVAQVLFKLLATHIAGVVTKILSSALIKKLVLLLVKKVVIVAVTAAVVNFLAVHVTAAVGGSTAMLFVLPILIGFMTYKIATFPEKIGKEVSKSVRKDLSTRFEPMNKSILDQVYKQVFDGEKLVDVLAEDEEFQGILVDLAKKV